MVKGGGYLTWKQWLSHCQVVSMFFHVFFFHRERCVILFSKFFFLFFSVIATDWGGNLEFMGKDTGLLVR
jgi:hypothetical protein